MALKLTLNSPMGSDPVTFQWPPTMDIKDCAKELIDTIKFVCEDFPEIRYGLKFNGCLLNESSICSDEDLETLCERYNQTVRSIFKLRQGQAQVRTRPSSSLLKHIMQLCYNRSVSEPDKLNQYEPFSPEVYGETSFDLVTQIVESAAFTPKDIFIDLGSGVGQVVLQVAACTECEMCYGIEKADRPAKYAQAMQEEFIKWMRWYGKIYSKFLIEQGDFLEEHFRERISGATIVFVNNFAFGPQVDHQLKIRFANLKEGARIISSKAFCPLNFRITDRNLTDISCMMRVEEMSPLSDAVSWTDKPFTYFIHTMDSSLMTKYFHRLRHPELYKDEEPGRDKKRRDDMSSDSSRQASVSRSSSTATLQSAAKKITFPANDNRGRSAKCASGKRQMKNNGQLQSNTSRSKTAKNLISRARASKTKSPTAAKRVGVANGRHVGVANGNKKVKVVANGHVHPMSGIDRLLTAVRQSYAYFKRHMHTPEYRQQLELKVKAEQERSEQLQLRVSQLERQIACFQSEGDKLLGQCLRQIGLDSVHCPEDLFAYMQVLIDDIHRNKEVAEGLETTVTQLEDDSELMQKQIQQYIAASGTLNCGDVGGSLLGKAKATGSPKAKRSPKKVRVLSAANQTQASASGDSYVAAPSDSQLMVNSSVSHAAPFQSSLLIGRPTNASAQPAAASNTGLDRTVSSVEVSSCRNLVCVPSLANNIASIASLPSAFCAINANQFNSVNANGSRIDHLAAKATTSVLVNHQQQPRVIAVRKRQNLPLTGEQSTDVNIVDNNDGVAGIKRSTRSNSRESSATRDVPPSNSNNTTVSQHQQRSVLSGQLASLLNGPAAADALVHRARAPKRLSEPEVKVNGALSLTPARYPANSAMTSTHYFTSSGLVQSAVQTLTLPLSLATNSVGAGIRYYQLAGANRIVPIVLAPAGVAPSANNSGMLPVGGHSIDGILLTAANKQT